MVENVLFRARIATTFMTDFVILIWPYFEMAFIRYGRAAAVWSFLFAGRAALWCKK
jgi:hypothetical protein